MKPTAIATLAVLSFLAALAALLRWTPLGAPLRRRWATVVRLERHR